MQVFLVGGAVRDILLGQDPKDKDYVVINSSEQEMLALGFERVGKDFPVFIHPENGYEYALARKERKDGHGYNGFTVDTQGVTLQDDLLRRDLTINAMAMDDQGNIIDPFGGRQDLSQKVLRHVSEHFAEDPVRILRVARFSARYGFAVHEETQQMMRGMVANGEFDYLTPERVWKEFEKVLGEKYLANFFVVLQQIGALHKLGNFSSLMQDLEFLQTLQDSSLSDKDNMKLGHIFQDFSRKQMQDWKIPGNEIEMIGWYNQWKSQAGFYQAMEVQEKLDFIRQTKALHDDAKASSLVAGIVLYQHRGEDHQQLGLLQRDVTELRALDYEDIALRARQAKEKVPQAIMTAQLQCLQALRPRLRMG